CRAGETTRPRPPCPRAAGTPGRRQSLPSRRGAVTARTREGTGTPGCGWLLPAGGPTPSASSAGGWAFPTPSHPAAPATGPAGRPRRTTWRTGCRRRRRRGARAGRWARCTPGGTCSGYPEPGRPGGSEGLSRGRCTCPPRGDRRQERCFLPPVDRRTGVLNWALLQTRTRCVGPEQLTQIALRPAGDQTAALTAAAPSFPPSKPPPARHRPGARSARRPRCPPTFHLITFLFQPTVSEAEPNPVR